MAAFDTLELAKTLERDFPTNQAEALAKAMSTFAVADLASKRDIADLKQEIARVDNSLKQEIARLDSNLKQEIARVDADLRTVIEQGILTTRVEIKDAKLDLVKWIVGAMVLNLVGVAGLMITLIKIVPR